MVSISRRIMLSARKPTVRLYLRELKNMALYEPRIDSIDPGHERDGEVPVSASGRVWGKSWSGEFPVVFDRDGGLFCELPIWPLSRIANSYRLREVTGGTVLTHEEGYGIPMILAPIIFLLKGWLARGMEKKLWCIKEGAERLERQIQLRAIESQGVILPAQAESD